MNTLVTTQKPGPQPLERKNSPAPRPVINPLEQIGGIDRIGFPEDDEAKIKTFDANSGGEIIFNLLKISNTAETSSETVVSSAITDVFKNGGYVALETVQTGIGAMGGMAKDTGGAFWDLAKIATGKDGTEVSQSIQQAVEGRDASKLNPTKVAEEQKKKEVMIAAENSNTVIENATRQASQQEYEEMIKMALRLGVNVENLADKLNAPHLRKADLLRIYYLALGDSLQVAEQKVAAKVSDLPSPAKHGAEGPRLSNDDNKSVETHATAQTATG